MFGISVTLILRQYYKTNSGLPKPNTLSTPVYAFAFLLLTSDFLEGIPVVFATALALSLSWQAQAQASQAATKTPTKKGTK
jgi:hypothetical protein